MTDMDKEWKDEIDKSILVLNKMLISGKLSKQRSQAMITAIVAMNAHLIERPIVQQMRLHAFDDMNEVT